MDELAERYRAWASAEAHGRSAVFEDWALGIAQDPTLLALVAALPAGKRQANLVFAAARVAGVPALPFAAIRDALFERWPDIRPIVLERSTQTNEAARCAQLLFALQGIDGPIALLEVGASAGLCLYPDRYSYRYATPAGTVHRLDPVDGPSVVVIESLADTTSLPTTLPQVVWRAGIDLNPLDVADPDTVDWLDALIWPEHEDRRARLRAAASVVTADPPLLVEGDAVAQLESLARRAPSEATLVVFHSAVLAYLAPTERERFVDAVQHTLAIWVSNEGVDVLPEVAAQLPAPLDRTMFVLACDGIPLGYSDPHGRSYRELPAA